ncbi:MAG TPA: DUF1794 domain-containing protein [Gammaproteobacteria bacterium]|nr:DUF1794 domain-containing protein [Gammaproteobacteria bacterium]
MSKESMIDDVDYGPLAVLVGNWEGGKGMDTSPEPDGQEQTPYFETILFEAIGDVSNAESQTLAVLRYHQIVRRQSNNEVFHNETGYWMWDAKTDVVMQSLTIPRGVCVLAGGKSRAQNDATVLAVSAAIDDSDWGIIQSPFMQEKARTTAFTHEITVRGDELSYSETTVLDIYGKTFDHTDSNVLKLK